MARNKALQALAEHPLTAKFVKTLQHSDLPAGWQENPEIVDMAARAWKSLGEQSPFFEAWGGYNPKRVYHATSADFDQFDPDLFQMGTLGRGIYTTESPDVANSFVRRLESSRVMPLYSSGRNPYQIHGYESIPLNGIDHQLIQNLGHDAIDVLQRSEISERLNFNPSDVKSRFNRGTFDPSDPNILRSIAPYAAGAGLAGGLLAVPDDSSAMSFAGIKGMRNLLGKDVADSIVKDAEEKLALGLPKEEVFRDLGVFKGPEGKWRYEIDDSRAGMARLKSGVKSSPLGDVVDHDELLESYPDLARTELNRYAEGNGGSYQPMANYSDGRSGDVLTVKDAASRTGGKSTLLHEIQHAIQGREGFAAGGSPENSYVTRNISDLTPLIDPQKIIESGGRSSTPGPIMIYNDDGKWVVTDGNHRLAAAIKRGDKTIDTHMDPSFLDGYNGNFNDAVKDAAYENYKRLAGEAEAREVQNRIGMNMDERRANFPEYATRNDLIVKYGIPAAFAGGLLSSPADVWANYNEPPRDAIEESWNPVEALAGGLGGGVASAFAGVPMDLAATIGMDKLGGLLSAPGGDATDYGNIRSWR